MPTPIAHRYVELINAGRYEDVCELFAADGVFLNPLGQRLAGQSEITAFLLPHLRRQQPTMRVANCVEQGRECWAELEVRHGEDEAFRLAAANHFTLDADERVAEMRVFLRPRPA